MDGQHVTQPFFFSPASRIKSRCPASDIQFHPHSTFPHHHHHPIQELLHISRSSPNSTILHPHPFIHARAISQRPFESKRLQDGYDLHEDHHHHRPAHHQLPWRHSCVTNDHQWLSKARLQDLHGPSERKPTDPRSPRILRKQPQ